MEFYQEKPRQGVVCNYGFTDYFKTAYFAVDFVMPLTEENATGLSLLSGVLSRGSEKYPQMDLISRFLAKHYGASFSINASKAGEMEILSLAFTHLDNEYAIDGEDLRGAVLSFIHEMLFKPLVSDGAFNREYVAQEKNNLADKITGLFNDKRVYSLERCKSIMCADEAYGIHDMGRPETLEQFDERSLYRFYEKMMSQAYIVISYVGKNHGYVLKDLADNFSDRCDKVADTEVRYDVGDADEVIEVMDLNQSKLNLGYRLGRTARKKGAACRLFNVLFGGSATSKLFMNVRERLSLCYYCSSNVDRFKNVMFVSSGVEASKYLDARSEIEAQLAAIANNDFSDDELQNAKLYLNDSIRGFYDSESALASLMISGTLRGEMKTPDQEIEDISRVTREDIIEIAKEAQLDTVYFLKGVHNEG